MEQSWGICPMRPTLFSHGVRCRILFWKFHVWWGVFPLQSSQSCGNPFLRRRSVRSCLLQLHTRGFVGEATHSSECPCTHSWFVCRYDINDTVVSVGAFFSFSQATDASSNFFVTPYWFAVAEFSFSEYIWSSGCGTSAIISFVFPMGFSFVTTAWIFLRSAYYVNSIKSIK